jgi:hypothetical protein
MIHSVAAAHGASKSRNAPASAVRFGSFVLRHRADPLPTRRVTPRQSLGNGSLSPLDWPYQAIRRVSRR